ncbi:MAG: MBL fold metallo-hydrolase [Clostridiales Family XIII bacterium]|jgi:phosphoribosyl 1,2-cyclic phosphodiesterase|nr:MBL fold metallo-hydrolase [Clostridiales Family XIII bacterium]
MLQFTSIASGSSGNCYLIKHGTDAILVDAGISAKRILDGIQRSKTKRDHVRALLVTHEHTDHVGGVRVLKKRLPHLHVVGSSDTVASIDESVHADAEYIEGEQELSIGEMDVKAFKISHDAVAPLGYKISVRGEKTIVILTDTGYVTPTALRHAMEADILVMESNHDITMLQNGPYPYYLKQRILSDKGHLSNESCAEAICYIMKEHSKKRLLFLAHLSKDNNTPRKAFDTTHNLLTSEGFEFGRDFYLKVMDRDKQSALYEI